MSQKSTDETEPLDKLLDDYDFNVRHLWVNDREPFDDERPTASLVVRDRDGEIIGESERFGWPRVWALVAVDTPEDIDERREDDPPEVPEWTEWVHCEAPMGHHAQAIECTECGEVNEVFDPKMPEALARREPWEWINHAGDCSMATELDKKIWAEKQFAEDLRGRPHPSVMALDCIWKEMAEARAADTGEGYVSEAIRSRANAFEPVLEARLNPRYPACPECGGEIRREREYGLECGDCRRPMAADVYDEWWDQHRRLWGWRGHGDRGVPAWEDE